MLFAFYNVVMSKDIISNELMIKVLTEKKKKLEKEKYELICQLLEMDGYANIREQGFTLEQLMVFEEVVKRERDGNQ